MLDWGLQLPFDLKGELGLKVVFGYYVDDPERYGVVEFDQHNRVVSIEEKPKKPKSHWAAIGVYFYDQNVGDIARRLKPSARREYEITDLNNVYLHEGLLNVECLGRGFAWFDAGTHDSLLEAGEFVRVLRNGNPIADIVPIAADLPSWKRRKAQPLWQEPKR